MKKLIIALLVLFAGQLQAQSLVSEKKIELTKDQRKNEPLGALYNAQSGGALVYFESQKAKKEKGSKRTWQRYEMATDKDLNVTGGEYVTLGTKHAVRPRIFFDNFRIGYTSWIDDEGKNDMMMIQVIKFDNQNKIMEIKDFEVCAEKEFGNYRIIRAGNEIIMMVQMESKSKDKNERGLDYVKYYRINANTLEIAAQNDLNLLGKREFGLENLMFHNNKIYMVGIEFQQIKPFKWKFPKSYMLFKLSMDGTEEARSVVELPQGFRAAGVQMAANNNDLVIAGEYASGKAKQVAPKQPAQNKTVKVSNPYIGLFIMKYDANRLEQKAVNTYDYEKDIMKKLRKGNPGFSKKGGSFSLNDFYFLSDGSFYITAEMFVKYWQTEVSKSTAGNMAITTYRYYTHYKYLDAIVYKFSPNVELEWLVQIDRDMYTRKYDGHLKSEKPIDPGKLDTYILNGDKLAAFYNTPGKKYNAKRFGLSAITVTKDGEATDPIDFNSEFQFCQIDGGLIRIDNDHLIAVGTDKKGDNLWFKKIKIN
jgi:hypothetical protein